MNNKIHNAINSPNIHVIVDRKKGEWLTDDNGNLRKISTNWGKFWFVLYNLYTWGNHMQATGQLVDQTVRGIIKTALNDTSFSLDSDNFDYLKIQPKLKQIYRSLKNTKSSLYSPKTLLKMKELASFPELMEARAALKLGIASQLLTEGVSGSYVLCNRQGAKLGIFKPSEQEAGTLNNPKGLCLGDRLFGINPGTSYLREKTAYLLDEGHFSGIPKTKTVSFKSKFFKVNNKALIVLKGSFQKWVNDAHEAFQDYQVLPSIISRAEGHKIPADEIHKIAIFDFRTLNCDRHLKNFLVDSAWNVHPIDHGFILPGEARSIRFDWINFNQSKAPFSETSKQYIANLDVSKDIALIKRKIPNISPDTLKMIEVSTLLLQIAVRQELTAYQIADLMMKRSHKGILSLLNKFVPIPSEQPSFFHTHLWQPIKENPNLNLKEFLTNEILKYKHKFGCWE